MCCFIIHIIFILDLYCTLSDTKYKLKTTKIKVPRYTLPPQIKIKTFCVWDNISLLQWLSFYSQHKRNIYTTNRPYFLTKSDGKQIIFKVHANYKISKNWSLSFGLKMKYTPMCFWWPMICNTNIKFCLMMNMTRKFQLN